MDYKRKYQKFKRDINDYEKIEGKDFLGKGSYGNVYEIQYKDKITKYAAKIIESGNENDFYNEISILAECKHKTIIKFEGYFEKFFDSERPAILMELAKCSFLEYLEDIKEDRKNSNFNNTNLQIILIGISRGMLYLHKNKVENRDLKPENVLLNEFLEPLLSDFGISKILEKNGTQTHSNTSSTPAYMAPEMMISCRYSEKIDVFSFGMLLYVTLTGERKPYGNWSIFRIGNEVPRGYRPPIPPSIPKTFQNLIERCWHQDPHERPDFKTIYMSLAFNEKDPERDIFTNIQYNYYLPNVNKSKVFQYILKIDDNMNQKLYTDFLLNSLKDAEQQNSDLNKQNSDLNKQNSDLNKQIDTERKKADDDKKELNDKIDENTKKIDNLNNKNRDLEVEKNNLEVKIKRQSNKILELEKTIETLKESSNIEQSSNDETLSSQYLTRSQPSILINTPVLPKNQPPSQKVQSSSQKVQSSSQKVQSSSQKAQPPSQNNQPAKKASSLDSCSDYDKPKRHMFEYKDLTIDSFNKESGFKQYEIFNKFYKFKNDVTDEFGKPINVQYFVNVENLLSRINKLNNGDQIKSNFIEILRDEPNQLMTEISTDVPIKSIYIASISTEILYLSGQLQSQSEFFNHIILTNFDHIIFEFRCPSEKSNDIYQSLIQLKENIENLQIEIAIFYEDICNIDDNMEANINYVKIGKAPKFNKKFDTFVSFTNLFDVAFLDSVNDIGNEIFMDSKSLRKISLPSSLEEITERSFKGCINLVKINIQGSVKKISSEAFSHCTSLQELDIPNSVTEIDEFAFSGCTSLRQIVLPSELKTIAKATFLNCTSLENISIPVSVNSINEAAFKNCNSLKKLTIPDRVTKIQKDALLCINLKELCVPGRFISGKKFNCPNSGCPSAVEAISSRMKRISDIA